MIFFKYRYSVFENRYSIAKQNIAILTCIDISLHPYCIRTISDLDRSRLTDTRSAENDRIGADTDPEYRIDTSLKSMAQYIFWLFKERVSRKCTSGRVRNARSLCL